MRRPTMPSQEDSARALAQLLPKVQLHLHLDGSLSETFLETQAEKQGLPLPCPSSNLRHHLLSQKAVAFAQNGYTQPAGANWDVFTFCNSFLQTAPALREAAASVVKHLVVACNCWVVEIRFCPALHLEKGLNQDQAVAAVVHGFREALNGTSRTVRGGVILCALRSFPVHHSETTASLTRKWLGKGVVGLDLAGDEASFPLSLHERPLRGAVSAIPLTLHAGEWGATGRQNLELALDIGASRVGHALALKGNQRMSRRFKDSATYIETCLTANCTGAHKVPNDRFDLHPVKEMLDSGVKVAGFNCDNLLLSGTLRNRPEPAEEIVRARIGCGLSWRQIRQVLVNGAEASFDPMRSENARTAFLAAFTAAVDDVLAQVLDED